MDYFFHQFRDQMTTRSEASGSARTGADGRPVMDILESIFTLIQNKFLDILTILWIIWFAGVALGVVVSTLSSCVHRRTLNRLSPVSYTHLRAHETVLDLVCR